MNKEDIIKLVQEVAHAEATRYYRPNEVQSPLLVKAVFGAIISAIMIQSTRVGLSEEDLGYIPEVPTIITSAMQEVGWTIGVVQDQFNLD